MLQLSEGRYWGELSHREGGVKFKPLHQTLFCASLSKMNQCNNFDIVHMDGLFLQNVLITFISKTFAIYVICEMRRNRVGLMNPLS